jgi:hypothetical protein
MTGEHFGFGKENPAAMPFFQEMSHSGRDYLNY